MCMICFTEALYPIPSVLLDCGHVFHFNCVRYRDDDYMVDMGLPAGLGGEGIIFGSHGNLTNMYIYLDHDPIWVVILTTTLYGS